MTYPTYSSWSKTQIGFLFLLSALSPLTYSKSVDAAVPSDTSPAEVESVRSLLENIRHLDQRLQETVTNSVGIRISQFEDPSQIEDVVHELVAYLHENPSHPDLRPESARSLVLNALELLYVGRGNTSNRDGKGWYPLNRKGPTGLDEIERILRLGLLDNDGKLAFSEFVRNHDFDSAEEKKRVGFPPC